MQTISKAGSTTIVKTSYFLILLLALSSSLSAQQKINATLFAGFSNYSGDLQEKRFTLKQGNAAIGLGISYEFEPRVIGHVALKLGRISANDQFSTKPENRTRNLNFYSNLTEVSVSGEFRLFDLTEKKITPYITAGAALLKFNPHADGIRNLHKYNTEGQGLVPGKDPYKLLVFSVPFGGGATFRLSDNIYLGYEVVIRKTFTDYLDDVSTTYADERILLEHKGPEAVAFAFRSDEIFPGMPYPSPGTVRGSPKSKDWYYFSGLTLSVGIGNGDGKFFKKKDHRGSVESPRVF